MGEHLFYTQKVVGSNPSVLIQKKIKEKYHEAITYAAIAAIKT